MPVKLVIFLFQLIPIALLGGSLVLTRSYPAVAVICGYLSGIVSAAIFQAIKENRS